MDEYNTKIAAILRYLYSESGLSYNQISKLTGLSTSTVFRVINGEREITVSYLEKLCRVFGVLPGALISTLEK